MYFLFLSVQQLLAERTGFLQDADRYVRFEVLRFCCLGFHVVVVQLVVFDDEQAQDADVMFHDVVVVVVAFDDEDASFHDDVVVPHAEEALDDVLEVILTKQYEMTLAICLNSKEEIQLTHSHASSQTISRTDLFPSGRVRRSAF